MMWEDEVEAAAVDLEARAEELLREHRALDVPPRPAAPPGRVPGRVLALLVRLPESEVARILLQGVRLLLLDLVRPLAGKTAVLREACDPEVDVALDRVGMPGVDELVDEAHDLGDMVGDLRHRVGHAESERARVGEVPLRRPQSELGTRTRRGVVDLVVN